jgi:hypothetical protein
LSEELAAARRFRSTANQFRTVASQAIDRKTSEALMAVALGYEAVAGTMEAIDVTLRAMEWPNVLKPVATAA